MKYRREVDGLRAVAVLPVILFHGGVPGFGGGFVGVDVFFVISGYLITALIAGEQAAGTFTIARFYERRIRRILPALLAVVLCTLPFAWKLILPDELASASDSLIGVASFASNVVFWRESGYFATEAEFKPFLHTWSLAVEEQFYVFFPVLLLLIARFVPRWRTALLALGLVGSLAIAQWGAIHSPSAAFYLLPTRAWELMIGALLALSSLRKSAADPRHALRDQLGSLAGLAMIAYATVAFDKHTPFPGFYALLPTVGATLVIACAVEGTLVYRLLASRALVGIGLISYSAYLWHQPIFALARHRTLAPPTVADVLMLSVLSLVLAYGSWRFVERPFRDSRRFTRPQMFAFAVATSLIIGGVGVAGHVKHGFTGRFVLPQELTGSFLRSARMDACFDRSKIHERADWLCDLGTSTDTGAFLVTGDSHALSLLDTFDELARTTGTHGLFVGASGCPPLLGVYALRPDQAEHDCHRLNQRVYDYVRDHHVRTVYLVSRWTYYTDGGYDASNLSYIGLSADSRSTVALSRAALQAGLDQTLKAYAALGVRVLMVSQVPEQMYRAKNVYYKVFDGDSSNARARLRRLSVTVAEHRRLQEFSRAQIALYGGQHPEVRIIDLDSAYCDAEYCTIGDERGSRYHDRDHVSTAGALLALPTLRDALLATGVGRPPAAH